MRTRHALIGIALLLAALSHTAHSASWSEDEGKIAACFDAMDRDPALAVVNAKFARRAPTAAQLTDPSFASEGETEALRLRVRTTRPCRTLRLAAVRAHHPLLEPAYATLYYQADQVFDYLTQGFVAYGEANRLALVTLDSFKAREQVYFAARSDDERRALSLAWSDALQQAHFNPPPSSPRLRCAWRGLNLACE